MDSSLVLLLSASTCYWLSVTSFDVIHSLSLPSLGYKVDAIPGRLSGSILLSNHTGFIYGQCTELCGSLHSYMPVKLLFI